MRLPIQTVGVHRGWHSRTRRPNNNARSAMKRFTAAITVSGGGGGGILTHCPPDVPCIDCADDVRNIICAECGNGGDLQCCDSTLGCLVANNNRDVIDCTDPLMANACFECGLGGHIGCCILGNCTIIPPLTRPPICFQAGGRMFCSLPEATLSNFPLFPFLGA